MGQVHASVRYAIIESFTRTMVALAYADFCESEEQESRPTDDLDMAGAGEDWCDIAPEPTPEAHAIAAVAIATIEAHTLCSLEALYEHACGACSVSKRGCQRSTHTPEHFGFDVAMQYLGTGVAWSDDHAAKLDLPHGECALYSRTDFGLPERQDDDDDTSGGYCDCACRDCFEIAIGKAGRALCGECEEAGCEAGAEAECKAEGAYGTDEFDGGDTEGK